MAKLSELPLGLYEKALCNFLSWKEKFQLTRQSGYDYLEINIDAADDRLYRLYDEKEINAIHRAMDETGVPVHTFALTANRGFPLGSETAAIREKGIEIVEKGIQFASKLGIRIIHLAGYDDHGEKCNAKTNLLFEEALFHLADEAAHLGVTLAIETMDTMYMGPAERVMGMVRKVDSPFLQCYADIGNMVSLGLDPSFELAVAGKHIVGLHIKDAVPGLARDTLFGAGIVDFEKSFHTLNQIHYQGLFTVEMWSKNDPAFHAYLPIANAWVRNALKKADKEA